MSSGAAIRTSTDLDSPILGTHAVSTSVPLPFTIMHGGHRRNDCFGCQCRLSAGGLTGLGRIGVGEPSAKAKRGS
jgi:hypothetical protein